MKIWKIRFTSTKESCKLVESNKPADESFRLTPSAISTEVPYKDNDTEEKVLRTIRARKDAFIRRCTKK